MMNEEEKISQFVLEVDKVRSLELISNPAFQSQDLRLRAVKEGEGYKIDISLNLPPLDSIRSFLLGFRKFYSNNEPTNFSHVCNIIHKSDYPSKVKDIVSLVRTMVKKEANSTKQNVLFNDPEKNKLEYLIDLYFNGDLFHSDEEKINELERIRNTPNEIVYWYLLVAGCSNMFLLMSNVATAISRKEDEEFLNGMFEYFVN